jgi:hypothetical protein
MVFKACEIFWLIIERVVTSLATNLIGSVKDPVS